MGELDKADSLPVSHTLNGFANALSTAWKHYNNPK
jgi:hypothetical protein